MLVIPSVSDHSFQSVGNQLVTPKVGNSDQWYSARSYYATKNATFARLDYKVLLPNNQKS